MKNNTVEYYAHQLIKVKRVVELTDKQLEIVRELEKEQNYDNLLAFLNFKYDTLDEHKFMKQLSIKIIDGDWDWELIAIKEEKQGAYKNDNI